MEGVKVYTHIFTRLKYDWGEDREGFVPRSNGLRMWNVQREPSAYFGSVQHIQSMFLLLSQRFLLLNY